MRTFRLVPPGGGGYRLPVDCIRFPRLPYRPPRAGRLTTADTHCLGSGGRESERCGQGVSGANPSRASLVAASSRWHLLACGCITPVSVSHGLPPMSLCLTSPSPSLLKTPVIGFKASTKSGRWPLDILNLIPSAKMLFPNKFPFTGTGSQDLDIVFEGP